jgi:plastocyanin
MRSLRFMGIMLVFLVMLFGACGGDDGDGTADTGAQEDEAAATLELSASGFAFSPSNLEASGTEFTINYSNNDEVEHNLTIKDLDVDEDVEVGGTVEVSVTGAEPGTYDFQCEYHPDTMRGELTVSS